MNDISVFQEATKINMTLTYFDKRHVRRSLRLHMKEIAREKKCIRIWTTNWQELNEIVQDGNH